MLARGDRYILRAYSPPITIAGGVILDPAAAAAARSAAAAALDRLRRLDFDPAAGNRGGGGARARPRVMIDEAGAAGLPLAALAARPRRSGAAPRRAVAALVARQGRACAPATCSIAAPVYARLEGAILAALPSIIGRSRSRKVCRAKSCVSGCSAAATRRCSSGARSRSSAGRRSSSATASRWPRIVSS